MEGARARRLTAGAVAHRDVPTCRLDAQLSEVRARVLASGSAVCIVVNEAGVVLGRLGRDAWSSAPPTTSVENAMDIPVTYRPDTLLESLLERGRGKVDGLVITDSDGALIGLVRRQDALERLAAGRRPKGRGRRATPKRRAKPASSRTRGGRASARTRS